MTPNLSLNLLFALQDLFSLRPIRSRDTLSSLVILSRVIRSSQAILNSSQVIPLSSQAILLNSRDILHSSIHKLCHSNSSKEQSTGMT